MGLFAKGDIVIADFPYSDLSGVKRRPLLVVAAPPRLDLVVCLITSRARNDGYDVPISRSDITNGGLHVDSYARPCHLFALDIGIVSQNVGRLNLLKTKQVTDMIIRIVTSQD